MITINDLLSSKNVIETAKNKFIHGHSMEVLKALPSDSIDLCVTSIPYYGLRNYGSNPVVWDAKEGCEHEWEYGITKGITGGPNSYNRNVVDKDNHTTNDDYVYAFCKHCGAWKGELGQEPSIQLFVKHITQIFHEVKRVLKPSGALYLNVNDSYMSSSKRIEESIPDKSLMGVPERIMLSLVDDGYILRNKIIWKKNNTIPESVLDRFTRCWEYLYFFTKSEIYYFEQQLEEALYIEEKLLDMEKNGTRWKAKDKVKSYENRKSQTMTKENSAYGLRFHTHGFDENGEPIGIPGKRNVRDVWEINTKAFYAKKYGDFEREHFASYPVDLVKPIIKASSPLNICKNCGKPQTIEYNKDGSPKYIECGCGNTEYEHSAIVLDPFMGTGTTAETALELNRNFIGIDVVKSYIDISEARIDYFLNKSDVGLNLTMKNNLQKFF